MKRLIKISILFILSYIIISVNCMNSMAYYKLTYRHDSGSSMYSNVKINDIYYDLSIFGHKDKEYSVAAIYPIVNGDVLKIPDKISFKGRKYKVTDVSFDPQEEYNGNPELPATIVLPYKTIYLPKYATDLLISKGTKLPNLKKIYIPKKLLDLSSLSDMPKLKVIIDKKNPHIKMKNGAVYSKNGKKMYCLINSKKTYKIAKGTKIVNIGANDTVQKAILPYSVKELDDNAFVGCSKLKSVKLNKNLKVINPYAFNRCKSIKKIVIPKNVEKIDSFAFNKCKSLKKIVLPENLKSMGEFAFCECTSLNKVVIPKNFRAAISSYAFYESASLKKIVIPNNVETIGFGAFHGCSSLKDIVLPENIKKISYRTFKKCISLKKMTIPKNVEVIEFGAFSDCNELVKVNIESEIKTPIIGKNAFKNTKDGIQFIVKNQTIADQLKEQLNGSGVKNAKILIGEKVVYQNING